ncbi:hypothetical protein N2152v2_008345 [Parachlorella kessleri]
MKQSLAEFPGAGSFDKAVSNGQQDRRGLRAFECFSVEEPTGAVAPEELEKVSATSFTSKVESDLSFTGAPEPQKRHRKSKLKLARKKLRAAGASVLEMFLGGYQPHAYGQKGAEAVENFHKGTRLYRPVLGVLLYAAYS